MNLLLALTTAGLLICASSLQAQVSAVAQVTLTVVPGPGIDFISENPAGKTFAVNHVGRRGFTLHASGNVLVMLYTSGRKRMLDDESFGEGVTETLTSEKLIGVSKVEVIYLGS